MKYIYMILFVLCAMGVSAQSPETATGRIEMNDGRFVIETFTIKMVGDSVRIELGDLKVMNPNSPTVNRFSIPAVFAVSTNTNRLRKKIDPNDYAGSLIVTPITIEEREEELFMDFEIRMIGDVMNHRLSLLVIPELVSDDGNSTTGAGLLVNGRISDKLYRRKVAFRNSTLMENLPDMKIGVTAYTDTLIRYTMRMPYQPWMDEAVLNIHQVLGSSAGKEQLYTLANAGRVRLQPREPYRVSPKVNFVLPEAEQKQRNMQGQAFLDFPSGSAVIQPSYRRNPEELAKIQTAIREVNNNPDVNIIGLFIEGYASPEGSYSSNERLARERSYALSNFISQNYGVQASMIRTSWVAEDWDGLRVLVEESDLVRKTEVLAVIDSSDDPDRKEQRLRALGQPWTAMMNSMFPGLRRVEYRIDFTVKDYSLEESGNLATRNPEMLSQRELFLLAQTYPAGSPDEQRIFETIIRLYPDDNTAILNYSAVLLDRGETASAKRYLDRISDAPAAKNNAGIYYLLEGDLDRAEEYFKEALAGGITEAGHNLEEVKLKRENNRLMERYKR